MKVTFVILLFFTLSYIGGSWLKNKDEVEKPVNIHLSNCDLTKTPCTIADSEFKYTIQLEGEPSPLKPFTVILIAENLQPDDVQIEFVMDNMDMGFTRHQLKFDENIWQSQVILPVCSLGRKEWILKVIFVYKNSVHLTHFKFVQ